MNLSVHCCCMFVEEVWLCISFKYVFLDGCYLIGVIVINTVEARVLFTLRHGCASLLCETRGLSKRRHEIELSSDTVVWRHVYTERSVCADQSWTGDHACGARRVTVGFMWGTCIEQAEARNWSQCRLGCVEARVYWEERLCSTKVGRAITRAEHVELLWVSCEAHRLSKRRHGIEVSIGTVVWRHGHTERNVCAAPKLHGRSLVPNT